MINKYDAIKDIVLKQVDNEGNFQSKIEGLRMAIRKEPTNFIKCFYTSSCILVIQGEKQTILGKESITYAKGKYLLSTMDIPVSSRITKASLNEPFVVLILQLDPRIIKELILETNLKISDNSMSTPITVQDIDEELLDAFYRLVLLTDKNEKEQKILSQMILKEIYYRLLTGKPSNQLLLAYTKGTKQNQITDAINILKENYNKKLNMDDMARLINMAPSSFYRNFKKITNVTPLQFQKKLKLNEAQRLLLTEDYNATTVSYKVGYESPAQFNREYKKMFGIAPKSSIKKLTYSLSV